MANEKLLFKKGDSYSNLKENVIDKGFVKTGALYLTEEDGGLYYGTGENSVRKISGTVQVCTSEEFQNNSNKPLDMVYLLSDTMEFAFYSNNIWNLIGFNLMSLFSIGPSDPGINSGKIWIDTSKISAVYADDVEF